jgi:hypothetical protein
MNLRSCLRFVSEKSPALEDADEGSSDCFAENMRGRITEASGQDNVLRV